jgi:hypothetical protein
LCNHDYPRTPGTYNPSRARSTGFSHRVGAFSLLCSGPSLCPSPMPQGQAALTFAQWGTPTRGSPISLHAGIKSHVVCEENAHLRHMQRLIRVLQYVTILSLSRACLYPPSKAARLFSCSPPPRCPKPSPLCGCVRVHQHMIPDDMSIPRRRPWPIGVGRWPLSRRRELRLNGVLRSSLPVSKTSYTDIVPLANVLSTPCLLQWWRCTTRRG